MNIEIVRGLRSVETAIISAYWSAGISGSALNSEKWGGIFYRSDVQTEAGLSNGDLFYLGLKRTIGALHEAGVKKMVFVRGTPSIDTDLIKYCRLYSRLSDKPSCTIDRAAFETGRVSEDVLVNRLTAIFPKLIVVDPIEPFCDQRHCYLMREGVLLFRDQSHLSVSGSRVLARHIAEVAAVRR